MSGTIFGSIFPDFGGSTLAISVAQFTPTQLALSDRRIHLNFVSDEGKGINEGDEITVIVTDVERLLTGSYKVSYVLLDRKSKQDT